MDAGETEPEITVDTVDSEGVAQALVGKTILRGGCPYRITGYRPVARLGWELTGFGLPVHPEPGRTSA